MKKAILFFAGIFFLLLSIGANAQTQSAANYFVGKWDVLIVGTPNGDAHSTLTLERVDGKLAGNFKSANEAAIKLSKVEEKDNSVTVYFTSASGYDVYLVLEKKDDNNAKGTMMDMFDASGTRIVETK